MGEFSVRGKQVVVVGAARSGVAAAELLLARGARVTVTDLRTDVQEAAELRAAGVALELGGHREGTLTRADLVVLSPGVPPRQPVIAATRAAGVPVIGEVELASRWLRGRLVAVTGTKGKSTATTLTGRMLDASGVPTMVGGNIGTALSAQVRRSAPDVIHVVEVSSFQLELTETFHPWIAVFLNLSPDHLDRHTSVQAYADAKARIFSNQLETDLAVINADDRGVLALARRSRAQQLLFAVASPIADGVGLTDEAIAHRTPAGEVPLVPLSAVRLIGRHLLSDVLAAAAVATRVGVPPKAMTEAVASFTGLEHTLEPVGEVGRVRFVNDSKATNVVAARSAIESFHKGLVPIIGGRFKGGPLGDLGPALATRAEAVVAVGEARPLVRDALGDVVKVHEADTLPEAVRSAFALAPPGGTVLLAPACASFDMFKDYAERGRAFKQEVGRLAEEMRRAREQ